MQPKGLLIATAVLALLAGAVWFSNREEAAKDPTERPADAPRMASLPLAQIRQVRVETAQEHYTLERSADGVYKLVEPKAMAANTDAANGLFLQFSALDAERVVEPKAVDLKPFGLDPPQMTITAVPFKGSEVKLLIGDESPTGMATYAKLSGDPRVVTLAKNITTPLAKTLKEVRDQHLIPFDRATLKTISVTGKGAMTISKGDSGWLMDGGRADGSVVEELLNALDGARMNPTEDAASAEASSKDWPKASAAGNVKVTDVNGTRTLEVRRMGGEVLLKSDSIEGIHKGVASLADAVAKSAAEYRNKSVFDFGFDDPTRLEVKGAGLNRVLLQAEAKWTEAGKAMDSIGAQSLVDRLRELKATSFGRAAGATDLEITVVSNGGKRSEQVVITKNGMQYAATRKGEKDAYLLEAKAVEELRQAAADVRPAVEAKSAGEQKKSK